MFDATAKPPSGILSGNGNQYGDFDECLSVDGAVRGKYCLASLEVTLEGDDRMEQLDNLVHSGHYIRSNLTDVSIMNILSHIYKVNLFICKTAFMTCIAYL